MKSFHIIVYMEHLPNHTNYYLKYNDYVLLVVTEFIYLTRSSLVKLG